MTQDAVVFAMTARENIGYGRLEASEDELLDASRRGHADEFIRRLPDGYDTVIGEFGETLSGGECQRLALARRPAIRYDTLPDALRPLLPPGCRCASARTQALLRPIAPGKVTTSFAPLGRVLFWELFCALCHRRIPRFAEASFAR